MPNTRIALASLALAFAFGAAGAARADCESDLLQLEQAFKTPDMKADAKAALEEAKTKAVAALHKDDDKTCHVAIDEGMAKAGMKLK